MEIGKGIYSHYRILCFSFKYVTILIISGERYERFESGHFFVKGLFNDVNVEKTIERFPKSSHGIIGQTQRLKC